MPVLFLRFLGGGIYCARCGGIVVPALDPLFLPVSLAESLTVVVIDTSSVLELLICPHSFPPLHSPRP